MYVYYNCTRVLCECHGYRRDRESSRVSVKVLKRLSQKIIKLRNYVQVKTYQSHRKSMILLKIMQNERKVHMKQELGLYKKLEGN